MDYERYCYSAFLGWLVKNKLGNAFQIDNSDVLLALVAIFFSCSSKDSLSSSTRDAVLRKLFAWKYSLVAINDAHINAS